MTIQHGSAVHNKEELTPKKSKKWKPFDLGVPKKERDRFYLDLPKKDRTLIDAMALAIHMVRTDADIGLCHQLAMLIIIHEGMDRVRFDAHGRIEHLERNKLREDIHTRAILEALDETDITPFVDGKGKRHEQT